MHKMSTEGSQTLMDTKDVSERVQQPVPEDGRAARANGLLRGTNIQQKLISPVFRGGLAILDQGVISGSNFLISILLGRWLLPEQYGAYAVALAVFVLIVMLYQALVLEPMCVFGASAYRNCVRGYLKAALSVHIVTTLGVVFLLCVSCGVAIKIGHAKSLPGALIGVAVGLPLILLFWFVKRAFYLQLSPAPSALGAVLYCALTLGGLTLLHWRGLVSPFSAFLLMGGGSLLSSIPLFIYLKVRLPFSLTAPGLLETWRRHWCYGRWAILAEFAKWIPAYIFYPLLSSFHGMAQAGELRALMNCIAPVFQTYAALSSLLLPYAARMQVQERRFETGALVRRVSLFFVSGAVAYWCVFLVFKGPILRLLYSGRYTEAAYLLPVVAFGSVCWSASLGPATALRAMESPASILSAVCVSSSIAVAIGIPATRVLGLKGAVCAMALSEALALLATIVLLRRKLRTVSQLDSFVDVRRGLQTSPVSVQE